MKRTGYILLGVLAGVVFLLALIPSRALAPLAERVDGLRLLGATGRWWNGDAEVVYRGFAAGRMSWMLAPTTLLDSRLGISWRLRHADHDLSGTAVAGIGSFAVSMTGKMQAETVNRALAFYHMQLDGQFAVDPANHPEGLVFDYADGQLAVAGALRWSGGRTVYRLSGQSYQTQMPPMVARLATEADEPVLRAYAEGVAKPVLSARLDAEGWLHVSMSRRFAELAGNPWPGSGDADAVVLTVQEKVL